MEAALFYCKHFCDIKQLITELSDENCQAHLGAKHLLENNLLPQPLAFIQSNFTCVLDVISKLELNKLSLVESLNLINQLQTSVDSVSGTIGRKKREKLKNVLEKSEGYLFLLNVAKIISGDFVENFNLDKSLQGSLKYAPITTVDVERSFSFYKYMYSDRRYKFLMENFENNLIVYCFLIIFIFSLIFL